jgi:ABC-type transport system involved in multi-copper enzyme maturation permease subunit
MRPIVHDIALSFWRLLPANPIVIRVVQMGSKRLQHLWLRAGYLVVLLFVMLAAQLTQSGTGTGTSLAILAKQSSRVFLDISLLQLVMICLLAPIFTAGAISQEKDAETFNVLLTTPLTNAQIVLGSLLSRLFFVIVLLISGLPIFCITMLYGGVTTDQIFLSFGIAACTALVTGALAIFISVVRIGTRTTVFSFYAGIGLYLLAGMGIGLWPDSHVAESIPPGATEGMTWLAPFHPIWALLVALKQVRAPEPGMVAHYVWPINRMLSSPHTAYMVLTFFGSAAIIAFSTIFVRRGIKQGEVGWWSKLWRRGVRQGEAGEKRRRARRVWSNPVAWREAVTKGNPASSRLAVYGFIVCSAAAGLLLLINYWTGAIALSSARDWLTGMIAVEFVIVMLMGVNTAAMAITREREAGTIELLLSTPLTSRYIILGKLRGLISFTLPLLAVPAGTVLLAAVCDLIRGKQAALVYLDCALLLPVLLVVYSSFACMVGLYMSLKCTRSIQAVLVSVGILVAVGFGLGLCGMGFLSGPSEMAALVTPLTFVGSVVGLVNPARIGNVSVPGVLAVPPAGVRPLLLIGSAVAAGLYGAVVAGIYRTMIREFDMTLRKQFR